MKPNSIFQLLFLVNIFIFISCKKEVAPLPQATSNYIYFLTLNRDHFFCDLNSIRYSWELTTEDQYIQTGTLDNGSTKSSFFGFYTKLCDAKFEIYTPQYNSSIQLAEALSVGKKELGGDGNQFQIKLTIPIGHEKTYKSVGKHTSNGNQEGSVLEVLKKEQVFDATLQKTYTRVWFKLACKLYSEKDQSVIPVTYGTLIARFYE